MENRINDRSAEPNQWISSVIDRTLSPDLQQRLIRLYIVLLPLLVVLVEAAPRVKIR